jgi:hypothetical protein
MLYYFPGAFITIYLRVGVIKQTQVYSFIVVDAGSLISASMAKMKGCC